MCTTRAASLEEGKTRPSDSFDYEISDVRGCSHHCKLQCETTCRPAQPIGNAFLRVKHVVPGNQQ